MVQAYVAKLAPLGTVQQLEHLQLRLKKMHFPTIKIALKPEIPVGKSCGRDYAARQNRK
jgi:hypothetical protein